MRRRDAFGTPCWYSRLQPQASNDPNNDKSPALTGPLRIAGAGCKQTSATAAYAYRIVEIRDLT